MLGLQLLRAAWARRPFEPGRRCQRSLPTNLHRSMFGAGLTCPHSCFCYMRADMGTNLPSVDFGIGRTAVAICAGIKHMCAVLVRLPRGRLGGFDFLNGAIGHHT